MVYFCKFGKEIPHLVPNQPVAPSMKKAHLTCENKIENSFFFFT